MISTLKNWMFKSYQLYQLYVKDKYVETNQTVEKRKHTLGTLSFANKGRSCETTTVVRKLRFEK